MSLNTIKMRRVSAAVFLTTGITTGIVTLTACGGGGGGDTTLGGVTIPSERVAISSSNVDEVIIESDDSKAKADEAIDTANSSSTSDTTAPSQSTTSSSLASVKQLNITALARKNSISPLATDSCLGGGTMTTPDNVDGIGDYVYDNCEYFGWVYNGTISVTGSFNADKTAFDGSYIYDHFSITNDQFNAIYDGMIDIVWSDDGIVTSGHYEIPSLTMVWGDDGVKISGYVVDFSEDKSTNQGYMDYEYTVSSTLLKGSVHAESTQQIKYYLNADYPYEGQVVWSGANGSSARVTVLPNGTGLPTDLALVEVDADGDGVYEESKELQLQEID
jgi:hypothetical protein